MNIRTPDKSSIRVHRRANPHERPRAPYLALALALAGSIACGSDPSLEQYADAGPGGDGQMGLDAALPDAGPDLVCDDLDQIILLATQAQANAGASRGRYPLVLAHGFFGFDQVGPLQYFNGADAALRDAGFAAYVTAVEPIASSVLTRGPELGRQIACIATLAGVDKVNLVGHSQGGLDARVVAADPVFSRYIASVTTVSTPHRGTLIADVVLGLAPDLQVSDALLDAVADFWGYAVGAPEDDAAVRASLEQLSVTHHGDFNLAFPDNPQVAYFSWVGRTVRNALWFDYGGDECDGALFDNPDARDVVDLELATTHEFLALVSGRNDGLVTLASGKWGTFMGCIPADHADQIGLLSFPDTNPFSGYNYKSFLTTIASDLEARGF